MYLNWSTLHSYLDTAHLWDNQKTVLEVYQDDYITLIIELNHFMITGNIIKMISIQSSVFRLRSNVLIFNVSFFLA